MTLSSSGKSRNSIAQNCTVQRALTGANDNDNLKTNNMGKVHGSLARAGKVKAATPKVDKQEKKKSPKGRAKKRILYNRRFVNVTTLPGGKRRMNPNPEK